MPKRNANGEFIFKDYPEFKPNLSPREMFKSGIMGGCYYREIYSHITKKSYKNVHKKYSFLRNIPDEIMTKPYDEYDKNINKYKVKVGTTLRFWEQKHWITKYHPYGWIEWYCDFFSGKRCPDDERQIKRWEQTAGENSRFRLWLCNIIVKNKTRYNDYSISPKIRQTLLHWGYELTIKDLNNYKKHHKKK
jgi:hypothetical protein